MVHLNSRSALQRTTTSLVISAWPEAPSPPATNGSVIVHSSSVNNGPHPKKEKTNKSHPGLCKRLIECLNENVYFDEIAVGFTKLQSECRDFVATLKHYKVPLPNDIQTLGGNLLFSLPQLEFLGGVEIVDSIQKNLKKPKIADTLLDRRKTIWGMWNQTTTEFAALTTM
jgi:TATA-binding protein-associated factor